MVVELELVLSLRLDFVGISMFFVGSDVSCFVDNKFDDEDDEDDDDDLLIC